MDGKSPFPPHLASRVVFPVRSDRSLANDGSRRFASARQPAPPETNTYARKVQQKAPLLALVLKLLHRYLGRDHFQYSHVYMLRLRHT